MEKITSTAYRSDRKLWLTADREHVVEDGSSEAAFLFAGEGDEITTEDAERYGLLGGGKAAAKPADKQAQAPANKAR
jgi:hypothetical protein